MKKMNETAMMNLNGGNDTEFNFTCPRCYYNCHHEGKPKWWSTLVYVAHRLTCNE